MRKEVTPEMLNYNKYPGPQFIHFENIVKSDDIEFQLVINEKSAFDVTVFGQRFSEILLKYDFIVGDWGNEQLRLRGFYKDASTIRKNSRISRLEDYIKEYCNFGCAYFVLENPNPRDIKFDDERPHKRHKSRSKSQSSKSQTRNNRSQSNANAHFTSKKRKDTKRRQERHIKEEQDKEMTSAKQHFVIRKKK